MYDKPLFRRETFPPFRVVVVVVPACGPLAMGQTGPVKDIFPLNAPVTFNGKLYFQASSATTGRELYRSDLNGYNQELFRDINPGAGDGFFGSDPMTVVGSTLYFAASDGTSGLELWKTDGTAAGTVRVKDIYTLLKVVFGFSLPIISSL